MLTILSLFLKGIILGLAIAAPVGPIGILCIQQAINGGFRLGFASGLGAALADALYACIAGFGLTIIKEFLIKQQMLFGIIGGIFLCYLGITTLRSKVAVVAQQSAATMRLSSAFFTTFFLTLTNPMTILAFTAMLAGINIETNNLASSLIFIGGVFIGSTLWWALLSGAVSFFGMRLTPTTRLWINRISSIIIITFGITAVIYTILK